MPKSITLLMAQINPIVGAVSSNADKIIQIITDQQNRHDIILFPECVLTGYPPEDLLFRKKLFIEIDCALKKIAECTNNCHVIIGHPSRHNNLLHNSASIFFNRSCIYTYYKQKLPNYGVFDETRYFIPGKANPCLFKIKNYIIGLCICEDIWHKGPVDMMLDHNADIILTINASPFELNKHEKRLDISKKYAKKGVSFVYLNQVGGQDELVFDGRSFALDSKGNIKAQAPAFIEHLQTITFNNNEIISEIARPLEPHALIYKALVCGLKDYVNKNNFPGVLLGLSGGIDSALTLAIAVDALGPSRVKAVLMPSRYTAEISNQDALLEINLLNVDYFTLPIEDTFNTLQKTLESAFIGYQQDITEENLQARIRGILLMALSNKTKYMLLTTSNKSESAVGYATLYGDMCGGFAVLKDVLKTMVYSLATYRNSLGPVIPERVLTRAPSAELAPNQTDQDNLPPYPILDAIIQNYMENNMDADDIIKIGFQSDDVFKVINLIIRNEYKRHQAPPGVKISSCAFGRDWRYPLTQNT